MNTKTIFRIIYWVVIYFVLQSCSDIEELLNDNEEFIPTTGTIKGTIKDSETDAILSGITITIKSDTPEDGKKVITKEDGNFVFKDITIGTYVLSFEGIGYENTKGTFIVKPGALTPDDDIYLKKAVLSLTISPKEINLGELKLEDPKPTTQVTVTNSGNGRGNWKLTTNQPWLSFVPKEVILDAEKSETITFTIDRSNFKQRQSINAKVTFTTANGKPAELTLKAIEPVPNTLVVSKSRIDFGEESNQQEFEISNAGSGALSWSIKIQQPAQGQLGVNILGDNNLTGKNPKVIKVRAERTGIPLGESRTGTITITTLTGGTKSITVTIAKRGIPKLLVTPTSPMTFKDGSVGQAFTISNSGSGGTLNWQVFDNVSWLSVNLSDGTNQKGDGGTEITALVDWSQIREGAEPVKGNITVRNKDNNKTEIIAVSAVKSGVPAISQLPQELLFYQGKDISKSFDIRNTGSGGTLKWKATSYPNWLTISPLSGQLLKGDQTNIKVEVLWDKIASGDSPKNQIVIVNEDKPKDKETIQVQAFKAGLEVKPTSLAFGDTSTSKTFQISNSGNSQTTLSWTISEVLSWLSVSPNSSTNNETITVTVDRSGLSTDTTVNGDIAITSNAGNLNISVSATKTALAKESTTVIDGKTYKTIKIGTQTWMAENLNSSNHNNGASYCYDNDSNSCDKYGRLYTWEAAVEMGQKIDGWHLPTDEEWQVLEKELGMPPFELDNERLRGAIEGVGTKLKEGGSLASMRCWRAIGTAMAVSTFWATTASFGRRLPVAVPKPSPAMSPAAMQGSTAGTAIVRIVILCVFSRIELSSPSAAPQGREP